MRRKIVDVRRGSEYRPKFEFQMMGSEIPDYLGRIVNQFKDIPDSIDEIEESRKQLNDKLSRKVLPDLGFAKIEGYNAEKGLMLAREKIEEAVRETSDSYRSQSESIRTAIDDTLNPSNRLRRAIALISEAETLLYMVVELEQRGWKPMYR